MGMFASRSDLEVPDLVVFKELRREISKQLALRMAQSASAPGRKVPKRRR